MKLTVEDYRATPEGPPWFQLVDGVLIQEPSPTTGHQDIIGALQPALRNWAVERRAGRVFLGPLDVYLSKHDVFQPDLFFVSNRNQSIIRPYGMEGAPDLVVEVLSTSSARRDRVDKLKRYAIAGVAEAWLVDPAARMVEINRFGGERKKSAHAIGVEGVLMSPVLPGFALPVGELFDA